MNITYLIPSGFFPTCVTEIGNWYGDLIEKNNVEVYQANYRFWKYIFSSDISKLCPKEYKNNIETSGKDASIVLDKFKHREIYESLDDYRRGISKLSNHLSLLNNIQNECGFYFPYGVFAKNLNYKSSQSMMEYLNKDTLMHKLIEKSLVDINKNTDVLLIKVSSNEVLLSAMIAVNMLKKMNKDIYCCLVEHGYENFLLDKVLKPDSDLLKIFDSIIKYKDEEESIVTSLIEDINAGNRKKGLLTAEMFKDISTTHNKVCNIPVIDTFNCINMLLTRISYNKCYWSKCTFCVQSAKYRFNKSEIIKVEDVVNRIENFTQNGYTHFSFTDEALSPGFLKMFCKEITNRGLKLKWACRCRFEKEFTDELLEIMSNAGCYEILFGLESISENVLKSMNKYQCIPTADDIREILYSMHKNQIVPHITTIVGYPGEEEKDAIDTVEFIKKELKIMPESIFVINKFALFSKSYIAEYPERFNIEIKDNEDDIPYDLKFNYISGPYSTDDYLKKLIFKLNKELYEATYWSRFGGGYDSKVLKLMYSSTGHGAIFKSNLINLFKMQFIKECTDN